MALASKVNLKSPKEYNPDSDGQGSDDDLWKCLDHWSISACSCLLVIQNYSTNQVKIIFQSLPHLPMMLSTLINSLENTIQCTATEKQKINLSIIVDCTLYSRHQTLPVH